MRERHMQAARRRLGHLAALSVTTEAAERRILAAAEERLRAVEADLERLRPRSLLDADAGDRYREMVAERGQLHTVMAQSREILGG